jgi:predicted MFS family arabinose efflux permease
VGGVLGAVLLLGIEGRFERRTLSTRAGAAYAVMVLVAALSPWPWALPVVLVVAGVAMSVSNTQANSILQIASGPTLRGQSASLMIFSVRAGVSIGSVLTGVTSQWLGVQHALLLNGAIALVLHLGIGRKWSKARMSFAA